MNIFKSSQKNKEVVAEIKEPIINRKPTVADIHNEFDSTAERLLNEAKEQLANIPDTQKGERLKKLGFKLSKEAVKSEDSIRIRESNTAMAEIIEYFKQHYPYNKFVTNNAVEQICSKYGLVLGNAEYYKGDIPEKNLSEIENFVLRDDDKIKHTCGWVTWVNYSHPQQNIGMAGMGISLSTSAGGYYIISQTKEANSFWGYIGNRIVIRSRFDGQIYNSSEQAPVRQQESVKEVYQQPSFFICGQEADFDMRFLTKVGNKLEYVIPDPVVLQPVKEGFGYLIVSKWGDEASDPLLTNEIES